MDHFFKNPLFSWMGKITASGMEVICVSLLAKQLDFFFFFLKTMSTVLLTEDIRDKDKAIRVKD